MMDTGIDTRFDILKKYDVPVPRYTSYPTVPYWDNIVPSESEWLEKVNGALARDKGMSLYLHLPFCESLCTYCGCNKHITKNHSVEKPYIESLLREWRMYAERFEVPPLLREIHLGGGTPTFFSPENLRYLLESIFETVERAPDFEGSFEAHPFGATAEHLKTLRALGFSRISVGVQDFDAEILRLIHRFQTAGQIERITGDARALDYESVNFDLIFGLPRQTEAHIFANAAQVHRLRPDRLAFYSYAHVPWLKKSQRAYDENDLPAGDAKRMLYERGRALLEADGYLEIGMDHFALPHDSLTKAMESGALQRNFMGYTTTSSTLLLGLGASSISDSGDAFCQNEKTVADYQQHIANGKLPLSKGHFLRASDLNLRRHIGNIMCHSHTSWNSTDDAPVDLGQILDRLQEPASDGLVELAPQKISVTPAGRAFLRNICLAFDERYWQRQPSGQLFSKSV